MNCIVIYDIPSGRAGNRIRAKLADMCMDYGMNRIQYSAFAGDLLRTHQEELFQRARQKLGTTPGKVHLYPIGEREWGIRMRHEKVTGPAGATAEAPRLPVVAGLEVPSAGLAEQETGAPTDGPGKRGAGARRKR